MIAPVENMQHVYSVVSLTHISSLVGDFYAPDAQRRLAPHVHRHERPRVEASAGRVVRPAGKLTV